MERSLNDILQTVLVEKAELQTKLSDTLIKLGAERSRVAELEAALHELRRRINHGGHPGSVFLQLHRLIDAALGQR